MNDNRCNNCGRVWRVYTPRPCDNPDDCWECEIFADIGSPDHPPGIHWDAGPEDDADEVLSWKCPHGVEWDIICRGCGAKVSGWGMGAAGFHDLCGCTNQVSRDD